MPIKYIYPIVIEIRWFCLFWFTHTFVWSLFITFAFAYCVLLLCKSSIVLFCLYFALRWKSDVFKLVRSLIIMFMLIKSNLFCNFKIFLFFNIFISNKSPSTQAITSISIRLDITKNILCSGSKIRIHTST